MVGLLNRDALASGEGFWIPSCRAIHTFFMKFPIDVIFLDSDLRVVKLISGLFPWRIAFGGPRSVSVLELASGCISSLGVHLGDQVDLAK